jgi:uncharacterized protein YecT (DUF1311 family)
MIKKIILFISITLTLNCSSQTLKTIDEIERSHQECLDEGVYMKGCSIKYYNESDSLLNIVYKNLKNKLNSEEQIKFKKEQLKWLKNRDNYFEKVYLETINEGLFIEGTNDFDMVFIDEKAVFVFKRVKVLIKRLNI